MKNNTQDEDEKVESKVGKENQEEISQDTLQSLAEIMANLLDCEVLELKKKDTQEDLKRILQVLTDRRYDNKEANNIMINIQRMGILTQQQVDDAHELLYLADR